MRPAKPSLVDHYKRYAAGNLLGIAAGFLSFPITARLLSNAEFGVMGYWDVWVLLATALLKLGAGETMLRFYPHGGSKAEHAAYTTNFVLVPGALSVLVWLAAMTAAALAAGAGMFEHRTVALLAMGTVLVQVLVSHCSWVLASRELSAVNAASAVAWRWLTVLGTLMVLLFWMPSAEGVFLARLLAGVVVVVWALRYVRRLLPTDGAQPDWVQVRAGLVYGLPMALKEASNVLLVLINRAMLKWLGGDYVAVGIYTIGFSLAMYLEHLVITALNQALNPVATRLYANDGPQAVVQLKRQVLPPLVVVCTGLAAAAATGGTDFILLVAGRDKVASAPVFVTAAICLLVQPVLTVAGMGLLLIKRSGTVFALTALAVVFNVALNWVMIPRFGIMGATVAVCCSQLALQVAQWIACPQALRCALPWAVIARSLALAALAAGVALATNLFGLAAPWARLACATGLVALLYAVPQYFLEPSLRALLLRVRAGGRLR